MREINNKLLAKFEGLTAGQIALLKPPVDYSTSADDRERLWGYLMGKEDVWTAFVYYVEGQKEDDYVETLLPWLSLPLDGVPRWVGLLSEWLGMEEVREKFGWVEHHCSHCRKGDVQMHYTHPCEQCGAIGGKIRAEWAR